MALNTTTTTTTGATQTLVHRLRSPEISENLNNYHLAFSDMGFALPEDGDALVEAAFAGCDGPDDQGDYLEHIVEKFREYADFLEGTLKGRNHSAEQHGGKLSPALREVISNAKTDHAVRSLRAHLVQTKALLYAVGCIQALPEAKQEYSDVLDMCEMVRELDDYHIAHLLFPVEAHLGHKIDLWPDGFEDEADAVRKDHVRQLVCDLEQRLERAASGCAA